MGVARKWDVLRCRRRAARVCISSKSLEVEQRSAQRARIYDGKGTRYGCCCCCCWMERGSLAGRPKFKRMGLGRDGIWSARREQLSETCIPPRAPIRGIRAQQCDSRRRKTARRLTGQRATVEGSVTGHLSARGQRSE